MHTVSPVEHSASFVCISASLRASLLLGAGMFHEPPPSDDERFSI